VPLAVIRI